MAHHFEESGEPRRCPPPSVTVVADLAFKAAVLAVLAVFLYLYAASRDVGRYAYYREGELEYVLDTTTGVIYQGGYFMNHLTGQEGPVRK